MKKKANIETKKDPLADLTPEDFQGKTKFTDLSAEKKLEWLSHAAAFVLFSRRRRKK